MINCVFVFLNKLFNFLSKAEQRKGIFGNIVIRPVCELYMHYSPFYAVLEKSIFTVELLWKNKTSIWITQNKLKATRHVFCGIKCGMQIKGVGYWIRVAWRMSSIIWHNAGHFLLFDRGQSKTKIEALALLPTLWRWYLRLWPTYVFLQRKYCDIYYRYFLSNSAIKLPHLCMKNLQESKLSYLITFFSLNYRVKVKCFISFGYILDLCSIKTNIYSNLIKHIIKFKIKFQSDLYLFTFIYFHYISYINHETFN